MLNLKTAAETSPEKHLNPIVVDSSEMRKLKFNVFRQLNRVVVRKTGNPLDGVKFAYKVKNKYQAIFGEPFLNKAAKVDGRYFWRLAAPGFPSLASEKMHENEISRFLPEQKRPGLRSLLFAITKKCPLNCEHCFEWNNLNKNEDLPTSEIISIIHKYQDYGTTQMMLSGGEPMTRINDLYEILKSAREGTDFWIITSGLGLNRTKAKKLKEAGLTGVMISLDHFDEKRHDEFRGFKGAYNWALQAAASANEAGLVTTLSLCATRDFISESNLDTYMHLAKKSGVSFVQLIEPRATGRYQGQDIALRQEEINCLEKVYMKYNTQQSFRDFPIIHCLGYHQRRAGCFGGGNRFFYIDTDGDAHLCPFCQNKVGKAINFSADDMINLLSRLSCHDFDKSRI